MKSTEFKNAFSLLNKILYLRIQEEVKSKIELVRSEIKEYRNWNPDGIQFKKAIVWHQDIHGRVMVDGISSNGKELFLSDGSSESVEHAPYNILPVILERLEAIKYLSQVYEAVKGTL
jgi:hypothetical protein